MKFSPMLAVEAFRMTDPSAVADLGLCHPLVGHCESDLGHPKVGL